VFLCFLVCILVKIGRNFTEDCYYVHVVIKHRWRHCVFVSSVDVSMYLSHDVVSVISPVHVHGFSPKI